MKLVSFQSSRVTRLFDMSRITGQIFLPVIAQQLVDRYGFAESPSSFSELNANSVVFSHGYFEDCAIGALKIFNDGIIVDSESDTDLIDRFIEDLLSWLTEVFEFEIIKTRKFDRMYESQLVVRSSANLMYPLEIFSKLYADISKFVADNKGPTIEFQPLGITIAAETANNPHLSPAEFRIERRYAADFELNQYVATAPLRTSQHLEVLKVMEKLVG